MYHDVRSGYEEPAPPISMLDIKICEESILPQQQDEFNIKPTVQTKVVSADAQRHEEKKNKIRKEPQCANSSFFCRTKKETEL